MVEGVSNNGQAGTSSFVNKPAGIAGDFNTFLQLLTTQLQNQDPTEPLDTNDFTAQLVQFASVEQQIKQNELLTVLTNSNAQDNLLAASNLVGKNVEVFGNTAKVLADSTDAEYSFVYAHAATVPDARVRVVDQFGNDIYNEAASTEPGKHQFTWDGKDNDGSPVAAGNYTVVVEVKNLGADTYKPIATNILDTVREVLSVNGDVYVSFGSFTVPFSDVLAISNPKSTTL